MGKVQFGVAFSISYTSQHHILNFHLVEKKKGEGELLMTDYFSMKYTLKKKKG